MADIMENVRRKMIRRMIDSNDGNGHTVLLSKPVIIINYCSVDEALAIPLKDMFLREGIEYKECSDYEDKENQESKMIISIVTEDFVKDSRCMRNLENGKNQDIRRISILFHEVMLSNALSEIAGETIKFFELNESIEDYLLGSLYYEEPFKSYLGEYNDELLSLIHPLLHGSIIPPELTIGASDSVILAIGSMGFSTVKLWQDQGFDIVSRVIFVTKNENVEIGQPRSVDEASNWVIGINEGESSANDSVNAINNNICNWLMENASGKKLVLIGGLGKTTASLLIPLILVQAKKLGINTKVVCTMPLSFEGKKTRNIADRSLCILKRVSDSLFYYENNDAYDIRSCPAMSMKSIFCLIGYAIAIAINESLSKEQDFKGVHEVKIRSDKTGKGMDSRSSGTYGRYEVAVE